MKKPTLHLFSKNGDLPISINSASWHVLDEKDLFPEGVELRKAFGVVWVAGLFREPPYGILQNLPAPKFMAACNLVWQSLLRDQELLSYSYQYEFGREKGRRHGGAQSGGFYIRGLHGSITTRPTGYCTIHLRPPTSPNASRRPEVAEIIDLRKCRQIETDDAGTLKAHRRKLDVDWYREMPRILSFAENCGGDKIEVRLA